MAGDCDKNKKKDEEIRHYLPPSARRKRDCKRLSVCHGGKVLACNVSISSSLLNALTTRFSTTLRTLLSSRTWSETCFVFIRTSEGRGSAVRHRRGKDRPSLGQTAGMSQPRTKKKTKKKLAAEDVPTLTQDHKNHVYVRATRLIGGTPSSRQTDKG